MLERALNAPPRFSRRRFLATSTTASLAFTLASQPGRLSAQVPATQSSGSNGSNPNASSYAGYLKSDPAGISPLTGQGFVLGGVFYDSVETLTAPPNYQTASPSNYNPLNLNPPPPVEISFIDVELVIAALGPSINGRPVSPNFSPASNLVNQAHFLIYPAIRSSYTETPIVGGVPQHQHKSAARVELRPLMASNDWVSASAEVDFTPTPPKWFGLPTNLTKVVGPNSIWINNNTKATAPIGSSFEVTGSLGETCQFTAKLTLAAPQIFTGFTIGPFGLSTITVPPKVYATTFQWTFGIAKWNTATGAWDPVP